MKILEVKRGNIEQITEKELLSTETGMVVDGDSLDFILESNTYLRKWIRLTRHCKAVLISRYGL